MKQNVFKSTDILKIDCFTSDHWYVGLYDDDDEDVNMLPDFQYQDEAIKWCEKHNLKAYYEIGVEKDSNTFYQLLETCTNRVMIENQCGAWLSLPTLKELIFLHSPPDQF